MRVVGYDDLVPGIVPWRAELVGAVAGVLVGDVVATLEHRADTEAVGPGHGGVALHAGRREVVVAQRLAAGGTRLGDGLRVRERDRLPAPVDPLAALLERPLGLLLRGGPRVRRGE